MNSSELIHVADRIVGRPLLCLPEKVETILGVLGNRIGLPIDVRAVADADREPALAYYASRFAGEKSANGKYRVADGVAIIPVLGTLVNRGAWLGAQSGMTSYEGLTEQLKTAERDSAVRAVILDMDTPGGEASGAFEMPAMIRAIGKRKPVVAVVNDMAASAGYAIASAASKIYVTQTGLVGSIGVVLVHFDRSKQLDMAGIAPTIIHAGAKKADGNPYGPLPAAVRERLKAEVEGLRELFIDTVAAGRPGIKKADIKATEAGCFMGQSAVDIGLADGIATFDQVLASLRSGGNGHQATGNGISLAVPAVSTDSTPTEETLEMSTATPAPVPDTAAIEAAASSARAEGDKAGRSAERARIKGILAGADSASNPHLAQHLAFDTDMSAEDAAKALAAAKDGTPVQAAGDKSLYQAMAATGGTPKVQGAAGGDGASTAESGLVAGMRAKFAKK
jgi:capsid assembly protease